MAEGVPDKYRAVARVKGRELLFRHRDALNVLNDLEGSGAVILGMSFFKDHEEHVIEMIGNDADYSSLSNHPDAAARTLSEAKQLLSDRLPDGADWVSLNVMEPTHDLD